MVRITCSRILKFSKPYFWLGTQSSNHGFNSRAQSHNPTTKMITSSLRDDVLTRNTWQNRSFFQCRRVSSSHAQMANDHQSVTIETFDALCEEGKIIEAVEILEDKGCVVDLPRLLGLAKLCGEAEALEEARVVHARITNSPSLDVKSYITIIKMYFDCGSTDDALNVFHEMPDERDSETWCVMMRCLAKNGDGELAIDIFTRFKEEGNKPDKEIFKAVFAACASLGDVNEGLLHLEAMYRDYGIVPSMDDYVSVTEMLAASGHLDEALEFVERMSIEPSVQVWETLMNLCWVHGDLELGDRLAELVKKLDALRLKQESNAGLVAKKASDSAKEKLKEMVEMRRNPQWTMRRESKHEFTSGDTSHPESDRLMAALRSLKVHMLEMGFVPATWLLDKLEDEEKEQQLLFRSNKLALARGLLYSKARAPVTVLQNLRICIDGHNTCKMLSLITGRKLITKASKRFHHCENGVCSCQDYW
ncbi:hypothetical protein EUTSA_v10017960mg [Eutrema salsugineum]|uniref:DYW domain-containing protein n=1 Tax=Eutrema salsugineum TaxID=72664 RepID=V4LNC8_EUTSA|nr:pentatricopeptide repeat-containing protein At2g34370, mitochondrial [Eutrema salsugineum]ESQ52035.1 hypothetical protein EUTSA_v10017960mg [Eutrema salsugineum]